MGLFGWDIVINSLWYQLMKILACLSGLQLHTRFTGKVKHGGWGDRIQVHELLPETPILFLLLFKLLKFCFPIIYMHTLLVWHNGPFQMNTGLDCKVFNATKSGIHSCQCGHWVDSHSPCLSNKLTFFIFDQEFTCFLSIWQKNFSTKLTCGQFCCILYCLFNYFRGTEANNHPCRF